jgi:hypothetical protein
MKPVAQFVVSGNFNRLGASMQPDCNSGLVVFVPTHHHQWQEWPNSPAVPELMQSDRQPRQAIATSQPAAGPWPHQHYVSSQVPHAWPASPPRDSWSFPHNSGLLALAKGRFQNTWSRTWSMPKSNNGTSLKVFPSFLSLQIKHIQNIQYMQ